MVVNNIFFLLEFNLPASDFFALGLRSFSRCNLKLSLADIQTANVGGKLIFILAGLFNAIPVAIPVSSKFIKQQLKNHPKSVNKSQME